MLLVRFLPDIIYWYLLCKIKLILRVLSKSECDFKQNRCFKSIIVIFFKFLIMDIGVCDPPILTPSGLNAVAYVWISCPSEMPWDIPQDLELLVWGRHVPHVCLTAVFESPQMLWGVSNCTSCLSHWIYLEKWRMCGISAGFTQGIQHLCK